MKPTRIEFDIGVCNGAKISLIGHKKLNGGHTWEVRRHAVNQLDTDSIIIGLDSDMIISMADSVLAFQSLPE